MHRKSYSPTLVSDSSGNSLSDPPASVGRETAALFGVKFIHGLEQAKVALLHQVSQGEVRMLVFSSHLHYEPQIGFGQLITSRLVACLYASRQILFLLSGQ